jgi:hypothetical protein
MEEKWIENHNFIVVFKWSWNALAEILNQIRILIHELQLIVFVNLG